LCTFFAMVITKDRIYHLGSTLHDDIIEHFELEHLDEHPIGLVRAELNPPDDIDSALNRENWTFDIEQDEYPNWTFRGDPDLEKRAREYMWKVWQKEKWLAQVVGHKAEAGYRGAVASLGKGSVRTGYMGVAVIGPYGTAVGDDDSMVAASYEGTAIGGDYSLVVAGDKGTARAGYESMAMVEQGGSVETGKYGVSCGGDDTTAVAGDEGKAYSGFNGSSHTDTGGTSITGTGGKAESGRRGLSFAGTAGKVLSGDDGILMVKYLDDNHKVRIAVGYVGENGIEPNTWYRALSTGYLVPTNDKG